MVPANAVNNEFVNFLLAIFNETSVVFTVVLHFVGALAAFILAVTSLDRGQNSHDALKQQEDIVE